MFSSRLSEEPLHLQCLVEPDLVRNSRLYLQCLVQDLVKNHIPEVFSSGFSEEHLYL